MRDFPTVLELVGNTPIIRLPQIQPAGGGRVLAKLEYLNPGGSIKDRIGLPMIEAAERAGLLRPGGTIVEPTSGNTGVGLAMVAAARGYRCIFVMADKQSPEKIQLLRALGAEVVVCPTDVEPEDPRSYYSVSRRLAEETPNAYNPNQYANPANPATHYATTGPEIWEQLGEELDYLVVGVGTGGTVTGVGRYLKERNPAITIVGADPEGSIYTGDVHSYLIEGVGEDFWPETFDPAVVDRWVADLGPRRVPVRASGRRGGGDPDRRLGRDGSAGGAERRGGADAGQDGARDPSRRRAPLPLEGVRRRLDAVARPARSARPAADRRRPHARQVDARRPSFRRSSRSRPTRPAPTRSTCCSATASRSCLFAAPGSRTARRPSTASSARSRSDPCSTASSAREAMCSRDRSRS